MSWFCRAIPASPSMVLAALVITATLSGTATAQTAIRFSLDSKITGPTAPFFVAIDKGYFKDEGLDVTIEPSASSKEAITRVDSGAYDMAQADINSLIKLRDTNPSAPKAVFVVYNRPPFAIIGRKSRGIEKPKSLEDKVLGAPTSDLSFAQWKIFTQANGIDPSKVKIENVGAPVREPMLQSGQVDAITGFSFNSLIDLEAMNVPVDDLVLLLMADYGVNLYGNSIIVSSKFAGENPDAVKGFLRAFTKALKDCIRSPVAAVDAVTKRNDTLKQAVEIQRLRMAIRDNIITDEVKANGYGAVDRDRLVKSIEQLAQTYDFKNKGNAVETFDGSFLPAAIERKAN